ncbi:MAG: hypothetical protein AB7U79_06040 [Candidatus Izemoplasmatales bacterium]
MKKYHIMTILVSNRRAKAHEVQDVLTKNGCIIQMRLGLHEITSQCAEDGLIILQVGGTEEEIQKLETELNALVGVKSKLVSLESE